VKNWVKVCLLMATLTPVIVPLSMIASPLYQTNNPQIEAGELFQSGQTLLQAGKFQEAIQKFGAALPLYQAAKSRAREAYCRMAIALAKEGLADYSGAIDSYQASLPIWREIDNPFMEVITHNNIGSIHYHLGEYPLAIKSHQQALSLVDRIHEQNVISSPFFQLALAITKDKDAQIFRSLKALSLSLIGRVYDAQGQYQQALEYYQQSLNISRQMSDRYGEGTALSNIGSVYNSQNNSQALNYYQQALAIREQIGDRNGIAYSLNSLGLYYNNLNEYDKALNYYQRSLNIFRELNNQTSVGSSLNNIGLVYSNQGYQEQALDYYQQALTIQQKISDRSGVASTLNNIGAAYSAQGKYQQAQNYFQQALTIFKEIGEPNGISLSLNNIGSGLEKLGQYRQALKSYQDALTISQKINTPAATGTAFNNIGGLYLALGEYREALQNFQQSLSISQQINDRALQGKTLNNISVAYNYMGQYEPAMDSLNKALDIARNIPDREAEAATIANIALVYHSQGQYQLALANYEKAATISRELGDKGSEQRIIANIGGVYESLLEYEQAFVSLQEALKIQRQIGDKQAEGTTLNNIGVILRTAGKYDEALDYFQQAQVLLHNIGSRREEAGTLTNIGELYRIQGKYQQAFDSHQKALKIQREIGDRLGEAGTISNIGGVYYSQNQLDKAMNYSQQSLVIFREIGGNSGKSKVLANLGFFLEKQGKIDDAIAHYQQSIEAIKFIQDKLTIEELKTSFAGGQFAIYERLIDLLLEQKRYEEAFNYVERSRAQAFLNQIARGTINFRAGAPENLLQKEREIQAEIYNLNRQKNALYNQADELDRVQEKLTYLEKEYANLLTQIKRQSPEFASLVSVDIASLTEIQNHLTPDTTLVEYFVTEKRTLAFIITRNSFKYIPLDVSRQELVKQITNFGKFYLDNPKPPSLAELYKHLIAPLKPYLKNPKIAFVPHNVLHYLPFAALTNGESYLIDEYDLVTLPSASVLRYLPDKRKPDNGRLLALGNPQLDLEAAEREVKAIAKLYNTTPLIGSEATETAVKSQAGNAGILHLAAHGKYSEQTPLFSTLYLAADEKNKDGRLQVYEIYGLDLSSATNLVVLSACETQISKLLKSQQVAITPGDEIVALNRAFLYAGTPSVIASLWSVDDEASGLLMQQFYTYLRAGKSKSEALRLAQKDVRVNKPHPYYWAAFVLTGDGGLIGDTKSPLQSFSSE